MALSKNPTQIDVGGETQKLASTPEIAGKEIAMEATSFHENPEVRQALQDSYTIEMKRNGLMNVIDMGLGSPDITPEEQSQLQQLRSALPTIPADKVSLMYKEYTQSTQQAGMLTFGLGLVAIVALTWHLNKSDPAGDARKLAEARSLAETSIAAINNKKLEQYIENNLRLYTESSRNEFRESVLSDTVVANTKKEYMSYAGAGKNKEFMKIRTDAYELALETAIINEWATRDEYGSKI